MAFNHVNNCDCPVGNCDCGPIDPNHFIKSQANQFIGTLVPKDLYMRKSCGELYEKARRKSKYPIGSNEQYIGKIDDMDTIDFTDKLFLFHMWMIRKGVPIDIRPDMMNDLIRRLFEAEEDAAALSFALVNITPLYTVRIDSCRLWGKS